jgi:hypothetical protein
MSDLTNKQFGRWTVLSFAEKRGNNKYWNCICDCGTKKAVAGYSLVTKNSTSCGCWKREKASLPKGVAAMHAVHRNYTRIARERGLCFELTMEQFKQITSSRCHYCGAEPTQMIEKVKVAKHAMNGNYIYNGIDRVDNEQGYTIDNCVSCCITCNAGKRKMTKTDFLSWVERVYVHSITPQTKDLQNDVLNESSNP